jgi:hypothetical protein
MDVRRITTAPSPVTGKANLGVVREETKDARCDRVDMNRSNICSLVGIELAGIAPRNASIGSPSWLCTKIKFNMLCCLSQLWERPARPGRVRVFPAVGPHRRLSPPASSRKRETQLGDRSHFCAYDDVVPHPDKFDLLTLFDFAN